jgi:hypothetical protein
MGSVGVFSPVLVLMSTFFSSFVGTTNSGVGWIKYLYFCYALLVVFQLGWFILGNVWFFFFDESSFSEDDSCHKTWVVGHYGIILTWALNITLQCVVGPTLKCIDKKAG